MMRVLTERRQDLILYFIIVYMLIAQGIGMWSILIKLRYLPLLESNVSTFLVHFLDVIFESPTYFIPLALAICMKNKKLRVVFICLSVLYVLIGVGFLLGQGSLLKSFI